MAEPSGSATADAAPPTAPSDDNDDHGQREIVSLMTSRVGEVFLRKPFEISGGTDLVTLCRELSDRGLSDALVRDGDRLGMFTTTNLRDALLRPVPPARLAVRDVATFPVMSVSIDDDLYDAMILMLRHRVHRLVVTDGTQIVGLLSQLDLMGFVANNSHLIALQAAQAESIDELRVAAGQINGLIRVLHADGVRIEVIAALTGELNRQIFQRLWTLLAPQALRDNSCLVVMGSEGRGEQIIKTDQDNGLIIREDFPLEGIEDVTRAFTAALVDFGYPECPGGIMVSRPLWCQTLPGWRQTIGRWLYGDDPDGTMNLAIFLDAAPVAGDASLLAELRAHLDRLLSDDSAFHARFAGAVNTFANDSGAGWLSWLPGMGGWRSESMDLKKLGIFPIVQGVRAMSLEHRIAELNTVKRLAALVEAGRIDRPLAHDLTDALRFLIGLKLDNNLRQMDAGQAPDNRIALDSLGTLDRQALKDSLAIVRRFRQWLTAGGPA